MSFRPSTRRRARQYAMQAIYQWQLSGGDTESLQMQFLESINPNKVDIEYFGELLSGVLHNVESLDVIIAPAVEAREVERVDPVERAILRLAVFELRDKIDVPYKVVINEALELAKVFGATDSYKFVNGVLDKLAKPMRPHE